MITLTGFADEAGTSLDVQIKATKELGWHDIESRAIDKQNIHDLSDADFDRAAATLEASGIKVNCFGSAIMNWQHEIDGDFAVTLEEVNRAIPRMQRLGTKMIRVMSYAVRKNPDGSDAADQMAEERFRRMREVKKMFDAADITMVHENCMNYGGMSIHHTLEMLEKVPHLRLVFDTGNPVFTDDRDAPQPYPKQSSWEFYKAVKEHIAYVHIKDGKWNPETKGCNFTYAGDGDGDVERIVRDLVVSGYQGMISIEPHIGTVFHEKDSGTSEEARYRSYVEYGQRFMKMLDKLGAKYE